MKTKAGLLGLADPLIARRPNNDASVSQVERQPVQGIKKTQEVAYGLTSAPAQYIGRSAADSGSKSNPGNERPRSQ